MNDEFPLYGSMICVHEERCKQARMAHVVRCAAEGPGTPAADRLRPVDSMVVIDTRGNYYVLTLQSEGDDKDWNRVR